MAKLIYLEWDEMNATAIANVAASVASATATDNMELAHAGTDIQSLIFKLLVEAGPDGFNEQSAEALMTTSLKWEKRAETAGLPQTYVFQLKQDRDACLAVALTGGQKASCWGPLRSWAWEGHKRLARLR